MSNNPEIWSGVKADTTWFEKARFGLFIHWGLYALGARHEWLQQRERISADTYRDRYFDRFDPDLYDPRAWARAAREAGMKYFVVTTKHHEGFCLWDSAQTDFKAPNTPARRDLLKPMVEAFRDEGLKVGFYHSLLDWHHPDFPVDHFHPQRDDASCREQEKHRDVSRYAAYLHAQVDELLTTFAPVDILWFDFSYAGEDGKGRDDWQSYSLMEKIRDRHPQVLINDRLDLPGSADFVTPEQYVPQDGMVDPGGQPVPWEGCHTFSGSWGYHRDEASWKSVPMLIQMLVHHVSRGGNMLLNVGPTARGQFDLRAMDCLKEMGAWMRLHGRSVYGCTRAPSDWPEPPDCRYTWNPATGRLYLHCFAWPFRTVHLPGLQGRVAYAQLLNDGSELTFRDAESRADSALHAQSPNGSITLNLPPRQPDPNLPVVELILKEGQEAG